MPTETPCRYCKTPLDTGRLGCGICLNCATATELRKLMEWNTFSDPSDIPHGERCLFVVSNWNGRKEVHAGSFNGTLGVIGGRFDFDWPKINQWVSVQHLVDLADLNEEGE